MNMHDQEERRRIAERASEWLDMLAEEHGSEVRTSFAAWIMESPLHVREFLVIAAIDRQLENAAPEGRMPIETRRDGKLSNVLTLGISHTTSDRISGSPQLTTHRDNAGARIWLAAAAIALLTLCLVWLSWQYEQRSWRDYATTTGEQNTLELADGTVVNLNTKSRLQVRFTETARDVRLLEGEALFSVRHDPAHPFRVHAGTAVIQAIGTEFNVHRRSDDDIAVAVLEGQVQITPERHSNRAGPPRKAPQKIAAGEAVDIASNGEVIGHRQNVDASAIAAWRQHRLVFYRATLDEIASEFNRYNDHPQIRVEGDELRSRRYTIILPANDPQSLIDYLRKDSELGIESQGDELIVKPRK